MPVTVTGGALVGVDAIPIEVEVDLLRRLPAISIVGLAASAVKESAERVRSALQSAAEEFPRKRVVVNLMPADVRKDGTALDLPMALGILAAAGDLPKDRVAEVLAAGELSLGGDLRPVRGALSLAVLAKELGKTLVLPAESAAIGGLVPGATVVGASSLGEVVSWLRGESSLPEQAPALELDRSGLPDLADVRGQPVARRALEISAAGGHHLLMLGPPGCGKPAPPGAPSSLVPTTSARSSPRSIAGPSYTCGSTSEGRRLSRFRRPEVQVVGGGSRTWSSETSRVVLGRRFVRFRVDSRSSPLPSMTHDGPRWLAVVHDGLVPIRSPRGEPQVRPRFRCSTPSQKCAPTCHSRELWPRRRRTRRSTMESHSSPRLTTESK